MKYLSICSGIEAATQAWHPLGWKPVAFSEIEPFPLAVLAHHYPETPNIGDITQYENWEPLETNSIDLLVGGTPCQSFSVAGLRKGLDDPRGNLMLTYGAVAKRFNPEWIVWENVPGVLSSNKGRDFGTFLGMLAELGYGFAYRVLDTQFVRTCRFGRAIPQRRRRVFVVGHLGDWRRAAAVLFDSESLRGSSPPSREKGEEIAGTLTKCSFSGGAGGKPDGAAGNHFLASYTPSSLGDYKEGTGTLRANGGDSGGGSEVLSVFNKQRQGEYSVDNVGSTCAARDYKDATDLVVTGIDEEQNATEEFFGTLKARQQGGGFQGVVAIQTSHTSANGKNWSDDGSSYTLDQTLPPAVAFDSTQITSEHNGSNPKPSDPYHPLTGGGHPQSIAYAPSEVGPTMGSSGPPYSRTGNERVESEALAVSSTTQVRRLTVQECEALQGFPQGYTRISWKGKPADLCPDGPRYKALGNSMSVNVMEWIGRRIEEAAQLNFL